MRAIVFGGLLILVGCNVLFPILPPPADMTVVPGGPLDTRPYFGRARAWPGVEVGDFMLASCGCGEWRILLRPDDGSAQTQFAVQFYSQGTYQQTGSVRMFGQEEDKVIAGDVDQDAGHVEGQAQFGMLDMQVSAHRAEAHEQSVDACGWCHLGDDPIYPLPEQHPKDYLTNPRVCLNCHTVNGGG